MFLRILVIGILASTTIAWAQTLPEHVIAAESSLPNGVRIQINVNDANLSQAQCSLLIDSYREKALPEGQVSVHKPSTVKALAGSIQPYCIENFDGKGIVFNTTFHPDAK